jgi:hypothetical protein
MLTPDKAGSVSPALVFVRRQLGEDRFPEVLTLIAEGDSNKRTTRSKTPTR